MAKKIKVETKSVEAPLVMCPELGYVPVVYVVHYIRDGKTVIDSVHLSHDDAISFIETADDVPERMTCEEVYLREREEGKRKRSATAGK